MANFMAAAMDPKQQERLMQMRIQRTIQEELGLAMSPPETARSSPGMTPSTAAPSKAGTPGLSAATTAAEDAEFEALKRERKETLSRQYQLNSLEQRQLDAVKAAFAR
jgi:hypothetical protein